MKTAPLSANVSNRAAACCAIGLLALAGCALSPDDANAVKQNSDSASSGSDSDSDQTLYGMGTAAKFKKRLTGPDLDTGKRWQVAGTDLGIPYVLENGSIGYLFGDTFNSATPFTPNNDWRSPVMLRSGVHPADPGGIVFDSAAKVRGNGRAPDIFPNGKDMSKRPNAEWTVIPNDGISFPETGRQVVSFMSVNQWYDGGPANWRTNYASLAYSDNGNDFKRVQDLAWMNNDSNTDAFQMWTIQRDGDWVYVFSVRPGRQTGPMMLQRVNWKKMFDKSAYEGWGTLDQRTWAWGKPCTPILNGQFSEPSVRRLKSGVWAMAYLNAANGTIVTRTARSPEGPWSEEKAQVSAVQVPRLYGGFIHPWSDSGDNNLHLLVSQWTDESYAVSQFVGTL